MSSETEKYVHLTKPYLYGNGVDIGTGGYPPVVPHAISVELPPDEFHKYTGGQKRESPIHLSCGALALPFKDGSLEFCYSSHLIEDFFDWIPPIQEWCRVVKIGGFLVLLYPDKVLWNEALRRGQPPNCEHRHESYVGEMTEFMARYFGHFRTIRDELTALTPTDYSIIYVAQRIR